MRAAAVLFSLMVLAFPGVAFSADPPLPEPLKALAHQGAELRYLGNDGGMDGWVTFKDGHEQYFYISPDQQSIIMGVLYNNKGDLITARQIDALRKKDPTVDKIAATPETAPAPSGDVAPAATAATPDQKQAAPSKAQQLYSDMEASSWIALGQKTAPVIYTIIDPQCPHCHDMIQDVRKSGLLEKGQIQMRIIPVGLMSEDSLKQSANLLAEANPAAALFKHLEGDKTALMKDPNPNTQSVQRNMVMMQTWKLDVTPFSLYKSKLGEIKILRGRPNDLKAIVADLK